MKTIIRLILALCGSLMLQARLTNIQPAATPGLVFVENKGQVVDQNQLLRTDIDAKLSVKGLNIFIGDGAIHYQWQGEVNSKSQIPNSNSQHLISGIQHPTSNIQHPTSSFETYRMDVELVGANKNAALIKQTVQNYFETYYLPQCEAGTIAHSFEKLTYKNIYPNIDWVLYITNGSLKYDFIVHPGGKASDIQLRYSGATALKLHNGAIIAGTPAGSITEHKPYSYNAATKCEVASSFKLANGIVSFSVAPTDGTLVIDPTLEWGTFFGTLYSDYIYGIGSDQQNNVYAALYIYAPNMATSGAHQQTIAGGNESMLVKFNSSGQRLWSTYYGGSQGEGGMDVAVDGEGMVYFLGYSSSSNNIATPGAHQETMAGWHDVFLAKFNSNGQRIWGTYFGGENQDFPTKMTVDPLNNIYITGETQSTAGIASSNAYQQANNGFRDAFLAKFSKDGVLRWSTYFGKGFHEMGMNVTCDNKGSVYMIGFTESADLPITPGAHDDSYNGGADAMLVKFDSTGRLQWSTYYGGPNTEFAQGIACDNTGDLVITGYTASLSGIATPGAHQDTMMGFSDQFIAKFSSAGVRRWGTYLGGPNDEWGGWVITDAERNIYCTGITQSYTGLATPGCYQPAHGGGYYDAFLTKLDETGKQLSATYFGGIGMEVSYDIEIDNEGKVLLGGYATSPDVLGTPGTFQEFNAGQDDGFIAKWYDTTAFIKQPYNDTNWCLPRSIDIPYIAHQGFNASNVFSIELSDANGSFASPVVIGTVASNTSGVIPVSIPAGTPIGTGYRIRLRASSPAYVSKDNGIDINIAPAISISAAGINPVCTDETVKLIITNPQPGMTYLWTGPNGFSSSAQEPVLNNVQNNASGEYILTATANGCKASDTVHLVIKPRPVIAKLAHPEPICAGGTIQLWAVSAMADAGYQWYGPAGFSSTLANPSIVDAGGANAGRYLVLLKASNGCVSDSNFVDADVIELKAFIKPLRKFYVGDTLVLSGSANEDSVSYAWEGPGGFYSEEQNPLILDVTPKYRGDYFLTVTSKYGCVARASAHAIVSEEIVFTLWPNPNKGSFTIKGNTREDQLVKMEIVDAAGRAIFRDEAKTMHRHFQKTIDTEGRLANGSYILRLDVAGKTQDVRFAVGQ